MKEMRDILKKDEQLRELLRYWVTGMGAGEQEHYIDCTIEAIVTAYERSLDTEQK